MLELLIVPLWLLLSALVGIFAAQKGRSGSGFFLLSFFLSPIIGGFFAIVAPDMRPGDGDGRARYACHQCAEMVLIDAAVCRYCGADLVAFKAQLAQAGRDAAAASDRAIGIQGRQRADAAADKSRAIGRALGAVLAARDKKD